MRPLAVRVPAWLPGAALLAAGGVVRLGDQELWLDEAFSLAATQDLVETIRRTGGTMALFYAVLTPWAEVSMDPAWLRLPALVAMVAALAVFAALVARQHGRVAGLLAGIVAACTYLPSRYAVEARAYGLVALLVAISWWAIDHVIAGKRARRWRVIHLLCVVLAPLGHGLAIVAIAAQTVAVVLARPDRKVIRHQAIATAASLGVVAALGVLGIGGVGDWLEPLSWHNAGILAQELLHPLPAVAVLVAALAIIGAATTLPALRAGEQLERFRSVALVCWGPVAIAGLLALSLVRPSQLGRYGLTAAFGFAGLVAVALARLLATRRNDPVAAVSVGVVIALVLTSHLAIGGKPQPWTSTAEMVASASEPGDTLLFSDPEVRLPFEAVWIREDRPTMELLGATAPLGRFDRFTHPGEPDDLLRELRPGDRIWYVEQELPHSTTRRPGAFTDPAFREAVDVERSHEEGSVTVRLLVVR